MQRALVAMILALAGVSSSLPDSAGAASTEFVCKSGPGAKVEGGLTDGSTGFVQVIRVAQLSASAGVPSVKDIIDVSITSPQQGRVHAEINDNEPSTMLFVTDPTASIAFVSFLIPPKSPSNCYFAVTLFLAATDVENWTVEYPQDPSTLPLEAFITFDRNAVALPGSSITSTCTGFTGGALAVGSEGHIGMLHDITFSASAP